MIKVKALAWIESNNYLFVVKNHDCIKSDDYYRPVGGGVEFGESTTAALHRELNEELGTEISIIGEALVLENIFTCDGFPGHEIIYLYPSVFKHAEFIEHKVFKLTEANGETYDALWIPISEFLSGTLRLVPEALLERYRALKQAATKITSDSSAQ